jgi:uncharacterized membrane protein (UPF0182 family)
MSRKQPQSRTNSPHSKFWRSLILLLLVMGLALAGRMVGLYVDWLWFQEVRFETVFLTVLLTKLKVGLGLGLVFLALLGGNLWMAHRRAAGPSLRLVEGNLLEIPNRLQIEPLLNRFLGWGTVLTAVFVGIVSAASWERWLQFFHATSFGQSDPLFGRDLGFYVFQWPLLEYLYRWLMAALVGVTLATALVYVFDRGLQIYERGVVALPRVVRHLGLLAGVILLLKAAGYELQAIGLLYSERGVTFGASYTDVHAVLPALRALLTVAVVCAGLVVWGAFLGRWRPAAFGAALLLLTSLVGGQVFPRALQHLQVAPNEMAAERPYIARHIAATRQAYGLERVSLRPFAAAEKLTLSDLAANAPTIQNIRLWEVEPLLKTYSQLQEIRTYYDFVDVDVDRYTINGQYRQVMLSPRELSTAHLPSKLWINERLTYTHGYGLCLSPVNRVTPEGLPEFMIQDLPPVSKVDLKITRPEIYYGEIPNDYVFVNTRSKEFDYPAGEQNVYTVYQGQGGVRVGGFLRRMALAFRFGSFTIILNRDITADSRILYYRNILERLQKGAPFLKFDRDPYLVITRAGRLVWIADGYTTTWRYPYAQPTPGLGNYLRNPVKATVDAYDGRVTYYLSDPTDPIAQTYGKIFPGLLTPLEQMPADLKAHLRYPVGLFMVQARIYATYHVTDPQVFYNQEDLWHIPADPRSGGNGQGPPVDPSLRPPMGPHQRPAVRGGRLGAVGTQSLMQPYYTIMRLPGEAREEFILMIPFTPARKDNLRAWMCARNDFPAYGQLLVYDFPKAQLVYGPRQIEARIEQDPQISQLLTLWRQGGSDVVRGNLLIIPIEESLLYVAPLYLQAQQGQIPELKRVIVAFGDRIAMEETLDQALRAVFGQPAPSAPRVEQPVKPSEPAKPVTAEQALQHLRRMRECYRQDDWAGFGQELKALEKALEALTGETERTR